ncbi:MAG TPA: AraC family transcriptional regulator [Myxococcaceae bacterium]|nr:AraC family transcriptional regulator [Myxococcaceae bacterium]
MTTARVLSPEPEDQRRVRLLDGSLLRVEDVSAEAGGEWANTEAYSPEFQLALPYRGFFVWEVGTDAVVGDATQALFVSGGEAFRLHHPLPGGYAELIVTPSDALLDELTRPEGPRPRQHPLFRRRSRLIDARLQLLRAQFLAWSEGPLEPLAAEEHAVRLLRMALHPDAPTRPPARSTQRLVERAKTYLAAELGRSITLAEVARAAGASPGYLTELFRAVEGLPLHAYLNALRLSRALTELPAADDLTELALELGFSSHSHFSARFRRAFGLTPSEFRRTSRRRSPPPLV